MAQLLSIFLDVLTPVFAILVLGYVGALRLGLDARTLSRVAYYLLVPGFIFNALSTAALAPAQIARMAAYILLVQLGCALGGVLMACLLRRPARMVGAYVLIAVFGNVGNFGLPLVQFALGSAALTAGTVYFLGIMSSSFIIGVLAAGWSRGGRVSAILGVFKTPAILAVPPALLINWFHLPVPLAVSRPVELLGAALVPTMLLALGAQLAEEGRPHLTIDTIAASAVRLLASPALAALLAIPFGLLGVERGAGIIQASTPAAVFASIIAIEKDLLPEFVTAAVIFSTLASLFTMTAVLALL